MAQRKKARTRKKRKAGGRKRQQPGNTTSLLLGLGIGLTVAVGIYVSDRRDNIPTESSPDPAAVTGEQAKPDTDGEDSSNRFSFYEMLPKFEVVIPEEEFNAIPDTHAQSVDRRGVYVLQAGSFSSFSDADRRKAQLALLGIVSNVQKVTVDDKTYHRVRIGPVSQLDQLNMLRKQLRDAEVEVLVIQVGE